MFWLLLGLLVACWLCAWLKPGTDLASSAARAFDSSVLLLSRGGTDPAMSDDSNEDDEDAILQTTASPKCCPATARCTAEDFNVEEAGYPAAAEARRSALRLQVRDLRIAFYGPVAVGNRPHCPIKLCANRR